MLPLQIPALRHSSMDARCDSAAQQSAGGGAVRPPLGGKGRIPYVKLCGLRLPDTLTPAVDEPLEAQVGAPVLASSGWDANGRAQPAIAHLATSNVSGTCGNP